MTAMGICKKQARVSESNNNQGKIKLKSNTYRKTVKLSEGHFEWRGMDNEERRRKERSQKTIEGIFVDGPDRRNFPPARDPVWKNLRMAERMNRATSSPTFLPSQLPQLLPKMAWQRPSCIVQAMQSARRSAQPLLQSSSVSPSLSPIPTYLFARQRTSTRSYATEAEPEAKNHEPPKAQQAFAAAQEIDFSVFSNRPARIVPASPAYFSGNPKFTDGLLEMEQLLAKYESLPTVVPSEAPQMAWLKLPQFREFLGEHVPARKFKVLLSTLQRLNQIDPALAPHEVRTKLNSFLRPGNPYADKPVPAVVDELDRARAKGKRKTSSAIVYLVEGEGEFMVNGKSLLETFSRIHDRESASWPLRCVQRLDKYNVWATVKGGGVTGQAEAITLAVARALLIHEPALKPLLRKGTCIRSDGLQDPSLYGMVLLTWISSRCCYGRCPSGRKKEAWSPQGAQVTAMGQEVKSVWYEFIFLAVQYYLFYYRDIWRIYLYSID